MKDAVLSARNGTRDHLVWLEGKTARDMGGHESTNKLKAKFSVESQGHIFCTLLAQQHGHWVVQHQESIVVRVLCLKIP